MAVNVAATASSRFVSSGAAVGATIPQASEANRRTARAILCFFMKVSDL
jgi:hypothetical protein